MDIRFKLEGMQIYEFAILEKYPPQPEELLTKNTFTIRVDRQERLVEAIFEFVYLKHESPLLKLSFGAKFLIEESDWKTLSPQNSEVTLPNGFAAHLMALTVTTARGVLFAKTETTAWQPYFIKVMNVREFLQKQDFVFLTEN